MVRSPRLFLLILATAAVTAALGASSASAVMISELRLYGSSGARDEFVELYNETASPVTVDSPGGWAVAAADDGNVRFVVPQGTTIPAGGHYLAAGPQFEQAQYATPDTPIDVDIPTQSGVALFSTADPAQFSPATRIDAFGFANDPDLYREGAGFPLPTGYAVDMAFVRSMGGGEPKDTGDNEADFRMPDTNGTPLIQGGLHQLLGAPGPQALASPLSGDGGLEVGLVDPAHPATVQPNTAITSASNPGQNSTFGSMVVRRTITNRTGRPLTHLRFRIAEISAFPSPSGIADLRSRDIDDGNVTIDGQQRQVHGTTVEVPPDQPNGGGINTSLVVPSITPANPLADGDSIHIQFRMGIQQHGAYKLCLHSESLPVGTGGLVAQGGNSLDESVGDPGCGVPDVEGTADPATGAPGSQPGQAPQDPQPVGAPQVIPAAAGDTRAPRLIGGLALSRRIFTAGRWGTHVSFRLDERAKVTFVVKRRGRRVGRFSVDGKVGVNRLRFKGRVGKRLLGAGRYRLVATATDAAGNRSEPSRKRFRIV